jgi:hypothetical protein
MVLRIIIYAKESYFQVKCCPGPLLLKYRLEEKTIAKGWYKEGKGVNSLNG